MKLPVLFVIIFICSLKTTAQTGNTYHPEPFPANPVADGWTALTKCDDCTEQVQLPFTYNIFGVNYNSIFINSNGVLSFTQPILTWVSTIFPTSPNMGPVFAPFWTDVDTRGNIAGNPNSNNVWYKFYPDRLAVIWNRVGYYSYKTDSLSTFEAVLFDNSVPLHRVITDVDVRLTCDTLRWVRGSAANTPYPTAGWDAGNGVNYYNMPGSATANLSGYPGPFSKVFQFNNIRAAQTLDPLPVAPVIRYPDTVYYEAGIPITLVAPVNTGGTVPVTQYGSVSTYAGSSAGYTDSVTPLNARFNRPAGLAVDRLGNVYVGDCGNGRIRKIPVSGNVTTHSAAIYDTAAKGLATNLIGSLYRAYGKAGMAIGNHNNHTYGNITGYRYNNPTGITVDSTGNVYVADRNTHRIHYSTASGNAATISRAVNKGVINEVIWNSVSEEAGDVYQVERSTDASHFITLGTVAGKAINGGSYTYTDQEPVTGINYYRLKFLNMDGSNGYSKIVSASKNKTFGVTVFPNPVRSEVTIRVDGEINGTATVILYDISGKQHINSRVSGKQIIVSMNGLPAGMYLVRYHDDLHSESFPVIKE